MTHDSFAVDATDRAIVERLRRDGRATFGAIGEEVGLSSSAVARRVARLEQAGVIRGYTAIVDEEHFSGSLQAFALLTFVGDARVSDIGQIGAGIPEVEAVFTTAGDPDALVHFRVRDVAHLTSAIDRLRGHKTVAATKTLMVLSVWSPRSTPPLGGADARAPDQQGST
jgi:Lrp/AsnC family leucine-responsive transcriptional regulator